MAALTDRQAARHRLLAAVMGELDRFIPEDESQPLRGNLFIEWEDQVEQMIRTIATTALEERSALDDGAQVDQHDELGRCPYCQSDRLYLRKRDPVNKEIRTPNGRVVLPTQCIRCRSCGRSFSPSKA